MTAAFDVMRVAIQDRAFVFTAAQSKELEGWVSR